VMQRAGPRTSGLGPRPAFALSFAVALALTLLGAPARAADSEDYDPRSNAWNGMATFVGLAEGMGFEVLPVAQLDWSELTSDDILFLVYPLRELDQSRLAAFVQAGGNVVVADDFGEAKLGLAALGLIVDVGPPHSTRYWHDHLFAPIATPQSAHPIADNVGEVVTNHPASFRRVIDAMAVIGFDDGSLVVAGERGTGRFVAISDPSIFINEMLREPFAGNVTLASNILRWLSRGGRARRVVLLHGDAPMYGDPPPFVFDPRGGKVAQTVDTIDEWLGAAREWTMIPATMKGLAAALAALLVALALLALPLGRGPRVDGGWTRFARPRRRDEPHALIASSDLEATRPRSLLVVACILRDHVQTLLATAVERGEPLYTLGEAELVGQLARARGDQAGRALTRVYKQLRALPSRSQAAAPWSAGRLGRREFDALYRDVAELCRTLGAELPTATDP
jgi:hypothetical protein